MIDVRLINDLITINRSYCWNVLTEKCLAAQVPITDKYVIKDYEAICVCLCVCAYCLLLLLHSFELTTLFFQHTFFQCSSWIFYSLKHRSCCWSFTGNLLPIIGCFYESFISNHMSEESPALYICNSTIKTPNVFPANSWSSAIQAHILVVVHGFKLYLNVCVWIWNLCKTVQM